MTHTLRLIRLHLLVSVGSLALCSQIAWADLNMGSKTIFTGTLIEVLAPGPDLQSILDNISGASTTNPYLVKLGPGVFDLGATTLTMKPYVEISGSGQDVTIIKGDVSSAGWSGAALILGENNSTLSNLTVDNQGSTYGLSAAIYNNIGKSPTLRNVTLKVVTTGNRSPVHNNVNSSPLIIDSVLLAGLTQNAMYSFSGCHPTVIRSYIEGVVYTKSNSSVTIEHSYIKGTSNTVFTDSAGATANVFSSTLDGPTGTSGGTLPKCAGVADENNTFYASTCPP